MIELIMVLLLSLILFLWGSVLIIGSLSSLNYRSTRIGFILLFLGAGGILITMAVGLWLIH